MPSITSAGVGSGLDINGIVAQLVSAERAVRLSPIQARQTSLTAKLSLYGQIKSAFSDFETATKSLLKSFSEYKSQYAGFTGVTLTNLGNGNTRVFTPGNGLPEFIDQKGYTQTGNTSLATINTPIADAAYGTYDINVTTVAQSQVSRYAFTADPAFPTSVGGGTLNIAMADGRNASVVIGTNASLADVAAAINGATDGGGASLGLTATIDGNTLVVEGQKGAGNAFTFSVTEPNQTGNPLLGQADTGPNDGNATNATGFSQFAQNNATTTQTARNFTGTASFDDGNGGVINVNINQATQDLQIDTLNVTLAANITGITQITVADAQVANPDYVADSEEIRPNQAGDPAPGETKKIGIPTAGVQKSMDEFIDKYNALIDRLKQGQQKGDRLDVDTTPVNLERSILRIMNKFYGNESKTNLGFELSKEGDLSLNKDKFRSLLENDPDAFDRVFSQAMGKDLQTLAEGVNKDGGALKAKQDTLKGIIDGLQRKQDVEEDRLIKIESRYLKQFTALDNLLAELQASSSFLSNALATLPQLNRGNK